MAPLSISILTHASELELLRDEWRELCAKSGGHHPFLTPTWVLVWLRVFGGARLRLHCLAVRDGRELVGLLLAGASRRWHRRVVPLRSLAFLPSGEPREDEIFSEYLGPLVAVGREREVAGAFADHLAASSEWDELDLPRLDGEAPAVLALEEALRARLGAVERTGSSCPFIALPRTWEGYLAALPSDHRYVVKRSLRDFEKWCGGDFSVEIVGDHAGLQRGRAILHELHESRWRQSGDGGVFDSQQFRRFHDLVLPELLERGELDLRWLVARGRPIAVAYSLIHDGQVYFYQGGRDPDLSQEVRPGIVLHIHAIRAAIAAGLKNYDFLAGDARYKQQLSTGERPLVSLRVPLGTLLDRARGAVDVARAAYLASSARLTARLRKGTKAAATS